MIINNARVVIKDTVFDRGAVEFNDEGVITRVSSSPIAGEDMTDANGAILMPGFIDIHIHGSGNIDFMDAAASDYAKISGSLYNEGTTTYLATTLTSDADSLKRVACAVKDAMPENPSLGGIHLEGPYISVKYKGAQNEAFIRDADINELYELQKLSGGNVRCIALAPETNGAMEFISEAVKTGAVCSAGHTDASFNDMRNAIAAGLTNTTHTHNAMSGHHHRKPGVVTAAMYFDELNCECICDGIHVCPDTVRSFYKIVGEDRFILVTDALKIKNSDVDEFQLFGLDCVRRDGAAYLTSGPLAGSLLTMDQGLRNLREWLGISLNALAKVSSGNAARALGFHDRGEIAEGKLADFVMLDDDLNILKVYKLGKRVK